MATEISAVKEESAKLKRTSEQLNVDATTAREKINALKKQMADMQKELEKEEKTVKQSRSRRRTHKAMVFYGTLIKILDLQDEESKCATEEDFDNLHNRILRKVKRWMKKDDGSSISDDKKDNNAASGTSDDGNGNDNGKKG